MIYTISDGVMEETFKTAEEAATYISEGIPEDEYDDMLDECYPPVKFGELEYSPSFALYKLDETAYHCGYNDYCDSRYSDILYDLERMDDGDEEEFYGYTVTATEEEEDEE